MGKRGAALIISYMVIAVLAMLGGSLVMRIVGERSLVQRHVDLTRAFWLAEAGIAAAIEDFPNTPISGYLDDSNNAYDTETSLVAGTTDRYQILSTGTVTLPSLGSITGTVIKVIVREQDPPTIDNAVAATGDIEVKGSGDIIPAGAEAPNSHLAFSTTFDMTEAQVRAQADHFYLNPANNILPVEGITWIEITSGDELVISDNNWSGSGILIVNGDVKITGGTFDGILWVNGSLEFSAGNPDFYGAVFVNCGNEVTTITGNSEITHSSISIENALSCLSPLVLSWSEVSSSS